VSHEWERRRSGLFNAILSGHAPEQRHGPEDLDGRHCVVVAKVPASLPLARLEETGRLLERRAGVMLWTVRHCGVVAAAGLPGGTDRDELRQRLAVLVDGDRILAFGLGDNAEGAVETRQSYLEATDALEVGPRATRASQPVHDYRDLAPMVALLAEPDRARRFVATALEPFSRLGHRKWMLPTVEAYLSRQGRLKEVATALGVHQNTVKYRVNELRPILDRAVGDGDQAAALLVAIRIHEHLAASVTGAGPLAPEAPPCDRERRPPSHPGV
jgi:sugar diacid utilization regulator